MPRPIIIDTDPGIDDALAIMLAAASPEIDLLGIVAVAGNVGLEKTAPNAAALADLLQLDIPVGRGAAGPLWRRDTKPAWDVHGEDGFGGYTLPASTRVLEPGVPLMARLIEQSADPVTVVAIGPLTNIAGLITHYPETARKVERFVIMGGGTLDRLGNTTPAAEFNIYYDPDSAAKLFDFGVPITMVGLNVTERALVGLQHLPDLVASGGPAAKMVEHMMGNYHSEPTEDGMAQHDSVALAAALDPSIIETGHYFVDVENVGRLTSGMTVVDFAGHSGEQPNCDVALSVDLPRFRALLNTRVAQLDARLKES
ncbi:MULTISPECIES: nucleoside hydrolase [unclassified Leucobacter]|uniref:nucleoside hydrolase n=1 Tax=unclassified Leucobacter TaxID=2621730 RepID=UPI003016CF68